MKKTLTKLAVGAGTAGSALFAMASTAMAQVDIGTVAPTKGFAANLGDVLSTLLSLVMALAALAVFLYLIWGAFEWITSGGDKGKTESARNKITAAVIGLIVLAAAYAILTLMLQILGLGDIKNAFTLIKPISTWAP